MRGHFAAVRLIALLGLPVIQASGAQIADMAAPSGNLFLVPIGLAEVDARNSTTLHDYGEQVLALIPNPDLLSGETRSHMTQVEDVQRLNYRAWSGEAPLLSERATQAFTNGYYIVALIGPLDQKWQRDFTSLGLEVVDAANPYALVVHADGSRLLRAMALTTSRGYAVVRGIVPLPVEAQLDPELLRVLRGEGRIGDIPGIRKGTDGRAVVRVLPFDDVGRPAVLAAARSLAQTPSTSLAMGFDDAILVAGPELQAILGRLAGAAYLELLYERELHNNIAALDTMSNVELVWTALGFDGTGIIVDHNDSGVDATHPDFPAGTIVAAYGTQSGTDNGHGTHTAGSVLGRGYAAWSPTNTSGCGDVLSPLSTVRGMAPGAKLVTNNIFSGGYTTEAAMMQWGYQQGARVSTNSWGYATYTYTATSRAIDTSVRDADSITTGNQQLAILFSAGNDGPTASTIGTPGTAKNAITVGASQNNRCGSYVPSYCTGPDINTMACFSGRGPAQGRIKPDLVAPGTDVLSTQSQDSAATHPWDQAWTGTWYAVDSGTSMACPITAGASATFFSFYNSTYGALPSPALAKAALINGAVNMGFGYPSNDQGWGRLNLLQSILGPPGGSIVFVDQSSVLATGQSWTRNFNVGATTVPLKVTLVWTDPPGAAGCTTCRQNDLNLVVTAPGGTPYYWGNQITGAWSTPNPTAYDTANNVENVFVQAPAVGQWTIQVTSANTRVNPPGLTGQDFAVVYSANFAAACANNPTIVDVTPNGPLTLCEGTPQTLTATPTGGTGVTYQWYRDGVAISGATASTYSISELGRHSYNCEAKGSGCSTGTLDSTATKITWQSAPSFAGLQTVTEPSNATCGLVLAWNAATSECSGPFLYNIYRSTTNGFTPSSSNRIASMVSGMSYSDSSGLTYAPTYSSTYYYVVRAVDVSNGQEDINTVQGSGWPHGSGTQNWTVRTDDFETGTGLNGWQVGCFGTGCSVADWRGIQTCTAHGGTHIFRFGGAANCTANYASNDFAFVSPGGDAGIAILPDSTAVRLSFWHKRDFNTGDGALMLISNDNATFHFIPAAASGAWLSGGYNGTVTISGSTRDAWTGTSTNYSNASSFMNTIMDLDAVYNSVFGGTTGAHGKTLYIAFAGYSNGSQVGDGWFLDDVQITANMPGPCTATPGDVVALTATSYSTQNLVEWYNPGIGGGVYGETRISSRRDQGPTGPTDTSATAKVDDTGAASTHRTFTDTGLSGTNPYYYGAWTNTDATPPPTGTWSGPGRFVTSAPYGSITGRIVWAYSTGASALVEPRMFPGIGVFTPSNDRFLHAMAPGSAGGNWPGNWKPAAMNAPVQSPATVLPVSVGTATRVVLTGSQDGYVYCFDADTGSECSTWTAKPKLGDMIQAQPMPMHTSYGGPWNLVIVGTRNSTGANKLCALNMSNGTQAWCFDNSAGQGGDGKAIGIISGAAYIDVAFTDTDSGHSGWKRLFFTSRRRGGGSSNTLWCVHFNSTTAALKWGKDLGDIDSSVTSNWNTGELLVGTNDGNVVAVNPDLPSANDPNPTVVWNRALGDGAVKGMVLYDPSRSRLYLSTSSKVWGIPSTGATGSDWSATSPTLYSPARPLWIYNTNYVLVGACAESACTNGLLVQLDSSTGWASNTRTLQLTGVSWLGGVTVNRDVNPMTAHFGSGSGRVYTVQVPLP